MVFEYLKAFDDQAHFLLNERVLLIFKDPVDLKSIGRSLSK